MEERFTLHLGKSQDVLKEYPDDHFDSVVCDPPYELGFMGKKWDNTGIANDPAFWSEVLRVLKPGGHLLAFSGSRTYHRMACGIEDAGFEIRDQIMWLYGSGFPKSHDVSKGIDKRGGASVLTVEIGNAIKSARISRGLSVSACDRMFCNGTTNWSWFEGRPRGQRAPTPETFARIATEWPELLPLSEAVAEAEREVIGTHDTDMGGLGGERLGQAGGYITAPATEAAKQWQGWGSALKPAHEPIVVARKPLTGTIAENVLTYGTGAINVDGCRVSSGGEVASTSTSHSTPQDGWDRPWRHDPEAAARTAQAKAEGNRKAVELGRWPANVIHDGSDEVVAGFPQDMGDGAARFFYCAKASKEDRDSGDSNNNHATVKPCDLMRYLCRLVTPPGGLILDPFMGSGSTGKAAMLEGLRFVGIDMTPEYLEIAHARIQHAHDQKHDVVNLIKNESKNSDQQSLFDNF